jgi:hypothetical protein
MKLDNFEFPSDELQVTCDLGINDKDMGGSSSSTESSINGFEPIIINVNLLITFDNEKIVKEIKNLAQSVDDKGAQTIYSILDRTSNVMGVSKVRFSSKVSLRELSNHKQGWTFSFTLKEHRSVAERKDERLTPQQSASPAPATGTTVATTQSPETQEQLTSVEQVLSKINEFLKPSET